MRPPASRIYNFAALDTMRGLAAFAVFFGHVSNRLLPAFFAAVHNSPVGALINGPAAVVLFFVLSGFVLSMRPLAQGNVRNVLLLVIKRWPRMAGTTTFAALVCGGGGTYRGHHAGGTI